MNPTLPYNVILPNGKCTFSPGPAQKEGVDSGEAAEAEVSRGATLSPETLLTSRRCLSCNEIKLTFAKGKEAPLQLASCKHAICHDCKNNSSVITEHFHNQHPEDDISEAIENIDDETYQQLGRLTVTCATEGCTESSLLSTIEQHIEAYHNQQARAEVAVVEQTTSPAQTEQAEPVDPIEHALTDSNHILCKLLTNIKTDLEKAARTVVKGDATYLSDTENPYLDEKFRRDVFSKLQSISTKKQPPAAPPPPPMAPPPPPPPPPLPTQSGLKKLGATLPTTAKKNKGEATLEADQALERKQQMQEELTRQIAIRGQFAEPDSPLSQIAEDLLKEKSGTYDESIIKKAITELLKNHPSYKKFNVTQNRDHYPESFTLIVIAKADEIISTSRDKAKTQQAKGSDVMPKFGQLAFEKAAAKTQRHHKQAELERKLKDKIEQQLSDPKSSQYRRLKDLFRRFKTYEAKQVQEIYASTLLEYNIRLAAVKGKKEHVDYNAFDEARKKLEKGVIEDPVSTQADISSQAASSTTESEPVITTTIASDAGESIEGATGGETSTQGKSLEEKENHVRQELRDQYSEIHKFADLVTQKVQKRQNPIAARTAIEQELVENYDTYFGRNGNGKSQKWNYQDFLDRIRLRLGIMTDRKSSSSTTSSQSDDLNSKPTEPTED